MYFAHADAALKRGYNCLLFDGPGQGRNLIRGNSYLRPDWENVVTPVIDYAFTRKEIDQKKIILAGWSFGGFLAPRAAAYEYRIAALIADPGQWDAADSLNMAMINKISSLLTIDEMLHWRIVRRGFWALNVNSLEDFFKSMANFKLSHIAQNIRCPTLITLPEGDPIASGALALYKALNVSNKKLVHFSEEEGSGGHCEMLARSLYNQRVFDWLDETLAL
jgi:pimeloyl-ACP methyl ester carboxylesterase